MSRTTVATVAQDLRSALTRIEALEAEVAALKGVKPRKAKTPITLESIAAEGAKYQRHTKKWAECAARWLSMKNRAAYQAVHDGTHWVAAKASEVSAQRAAERAAKKAAEAHPNAPQS